MKGGKVFQMKESRYNLVFDYRNKKLAFNSMTCALVMVDDNFLKVLQEVRNKTFNEKEHSREILDLIKDMQKGGFIVDDCFDELEFLKFKSYQGRFRTDALSLTIAPTFACNFACPYCYESSRNGFMAEDVMDAICREVRTAAENKKSVHISWYGGELLLAKSIVWKLSEQFIKDCETFGVRYSASIVTNGYLLDDETIKKFLKYRISSAQITIDGPSNIHNSRRKLKNSSKPTFDVILSNAEKVLAAGINVAIRINIDKTNENYVDELLDTLLGYGLKDAYVYLGHVKASTEYCQSISSNCLTTEDYAMKFVDFEKTLIKKGFNPNNYPKYPKIKSSNCGANSITSKVIAPDGSVYKCWHDLSDPGMSIGNIKNSADLSAKNIMVQVKYMLFDPFKIEKCVSCSVLPLCMGGCPTISNKVSCQNWKYSLVETLKQKYDSLTNLNLKNQTLKKEVVTNND